MEFKLGGDEIGEVPEGLRSVEDLGGRFDDQLAG